MPGKIELISILMVSEKKKPKRGKKA